MSAYLINFASPPEIGHTIRVKLRRKLRWCRLVKVTPYTRLTDGAASFILTWQDDVGYHYTSGLRSKSLVLAKPDAAA